MRARAPMALLASLAACSMVPSIANANDNLLPYSATVGLSGVAELEKRGFDVGEGGFDPSAAGQQEIEFAATREQVRELDGIGIEAEPLPIDQPVAKSAALGDSPNPFFNVYRSYMEPGGIADEMKATAAANPDVMKLVKIGDSLLGQAAVRDQDDRGRAQRARRHA